MNRKFLQGVMICETEFDGWLVKFGSAVSMLRL